MRHWSPLLLIVAAGAPAHGEGIDRLIHDGQAGLDLRYRYENVDQADKPETAEAHTLRMRLKLQSGEAGGFSALVELDHLEALGDARFDDTRNGLTQYPVIADPEGTDLNQFAAQYRGPKDTLVRLGRQRIAFDNERFVGPVGWRQNEQTFDALRLETGALSHVMLNYAYVDRVHRVFGPDPGSPPAELESDSHLINARWGIPGAGALTAYGYLLDFDNAPQLSSDTFGLRYEGERALWNAWRVTWLLEHALQQEAGDNSAEIDARYSHIQLKLRGDVLGFSTGFEVLTGERGVFAADANPAFQTPLATLHPFQGWADKFTTTPSSGLEDFWLGLEARHAGWTGRVLWHDFRAEAGGADYGTEWDFLLSREFGKRYELLVKYAGYDAGSFLTHTDKFWFQLGARF